MAVVNGALRQALSAAADHSSEIEAGLLRDLNEAACKRTAELRETLLEKTADVEREIGGRIEAVEKAVDAAKSLWEEENSRILNEQNRYRDEWREALEEKVADAERGIAGRIEAVEKAVDAAKSLWEEENSRILNEQNRYRDEWREDISRMDAAALDQRKLWQSILEDSDEAIEQYRRAQQSRLEEIERMTDDAGKFDAEMRLQMENIRNEITAGFAAFEEEMKQNYGGAMENFNKSTGGIRIKIDELEKEINGLKSEAYEKVSGNLKEFEELIGANLAKRTENINYEMNELRGDVGKRFDELTESVEAECRRIEHECGETLRRKKDAVDSNFDEEIKRIKDAFDAVGKNISIQTERYEKSMKSLETQLQTSLEDAAKIVDSTLKTEISRFEIQNAERLKKHERGMEEALRDAEAGIEERLGEIRAQTGKSCSDVEAYRAACTERFNEMEAVMENIRRQGKELSAEGEDRMAAVRAKIEEIASEVMRQRTEMLNASAEKVKSLENAINDADKRIGEFFSKTGLIDKTIAVKKDLESKIDDLNSDMEKLELRSIEVLELRTQFEKIKRMEEDLNNKMTQFDIEQQRIERMEVNFNRLLQTSQSVEERLKHITGADDMLQETQIKLRKLGDLMAETDEKYQRIEKKNHILEAATGGIEMNFKSLQESEATTQKLNGDIQRLSAGLDYIRQAVETLAEENEKAKDTVEKLSSLDQTITDIDARMQNLQKARAWLADLETRLDEKYRETQRQIRLMGDITKNMDDRIQIEKEGALPPGIRDNVISLKKLGWSVDDIVKSLKISRSAVELILETATKEK
jgi:chromosome segregation ATPase